MPVFYPNVGTLWVANNMQADLANSVLHLYQDSLSPGVLTTLAELSAAEADYDGYAAKTITAWLNELLNPAGGASIQAPTQQFEYVDGVGHVGNNIGGWYLVSSGGALVAIGTFPSPIALVANGQGIPLDILLRFGTGL